MNFYKEYPDAVSPQSANFYVFTSGVNQQESRLYRCSERASSLFWPCPQARRGSPLAPGDLRRIETSRSLWVTAAPRSPDPPEQEEGKFLKTWSRNRKSLHHGADHNRMNRKSKLVWCFWFKKTKQKGERPQKPRVNPSFLNQNDSFFFLFFF